MTTDPTIQPRYLTMGNAAQYLDCSVKTVERLCDEGKLRRSRFRGTWRIDREAIDALMRRR